MFERVNRKGVRYKSRVCLACDQARRANYYYRDHDRNKQKLRESHQRRLAAGKVKPWNEARGLKAVREFTDWLKELPCADCGWSFPSECMDFDHVRGIKLFGIGTIRGTQCKGLTHDAIMEELLKCEVVCACCHRIRTKKRYHEK